MRDMTQGSPIKLIIMFTIPLLIGNIFQQFYNMADTLIVGRTIGVNALAAVGSTGSILFCHWLCPRLDGRFIHHNGALFWRQGYRGRSQKRGNEYMD